MGISKSVLAAGCFLAGTVFAGPVFFVDARTGNDGADGATEKTAFRTLVRARDAVRAARRGGVREPARVVCAAGRYALEATVAFGPEDVDTVYEGYGAQLDGRVRVTSWTAQADGSLAAAVPGLREGRVWFNQLWVNGRRAEIARWPLRQRDWRYGLKRLDIVHPKAVSQKYVTNAVTKRVTIEQRLVGRPGDLDVLKGLPPEQLREASLVVCHNWDVTRRIIFGFDAAKNELLTYGTRFKPWNPWRTNSVYWLENVLAGCVEPGTWYLDKTRGCVVYRPRPGECAANLTAYVPRTGLVRLMEGKGSRGLVFRGFAFAGSDAAPHASSMRGGGLPDVLGRDVKAPGPQQKDPMQAGYGDEPAVLFDGAADCAFEDCSFAHTGGYAVWFREQCRTCRIERCHVYDCGSGGILMGGVRKQIVSERLLVKNCLIEDCGHVNPCGVGLWIGEPRDSVFTHNHIRHILYSGVSMGWNWDYIGAGARNDVSFNLIEDIGLGCLTDMAGIYTLGRQDGTRIHDNVIRRIDGCTFCRWALYLDQGSTGITAYNNLCYDAPDGGFTFHYGRDNVISNNIFAAGLANYMVSVGRAENFRMMTFTRNVLWWDMREPYWDVREPCLVFRDYGTDRKPGTLLFSSNLWCCVHGEPKVRRARRKGERAAPLVTFDAWRKAGGCEGDILADPHFADPAARDFRLTAESRDVLKRIGFVPFDFTRAGIERAAVRMPDPSDAPVRRPLIINEDNDHYFKLDKSLMTVAALEAYIDSYAQGHVTHFFMCPSGQRPSYDSKVWEPIWAGIAPEYYRNAEGTNWTENAKLLFDRGIDPYAVWIRRCRARNISPWITTRMNDTHFVHIHNYFRNTTFWRTRRDLWRKPDWKSNENGNLAAFDFSKAEARKWILDLVKEQIDRWDVDGVELDWMRCWEHLTPGREREQAHFLTDMVRTVRGWTDAAAKKRGHPVKLGVRVASDPDASLGFGVDAVGWAKAGLVDQIVASCFWCSGYFGTPLAKWRERLGAETAARVPVYPATDAGYGCMRTTPRGIPYEGYCGWADAQWTKGAPGLYLFNLPYQAKTTRERICAEGLAPEFVRRHMRYYPATYDDVVPKDFPNHLQLPIPLAKGGTVTLTAGEPPSAGTVSVVLAAKDAWGAALPAATLNGATCSEVRALEEGMLGPYRPRRQDASAGVRFVFPAQAMRSGENVFTVASVAGTKTHWTWCQLDVPAETAGAEAGFLHPRDGVPNAVRFARENVVGNQYFFCLGDTRNTPWQEFAAIVSRDFGTEARPHVYVEPEGARFARYSCVNGQPIYGERVCSGYLAVLDFSATGAKGNAVSEAAWLENLVRAIYGYRRTHSVVILHTTPSPYVAEAEKVAVHYGIPTLDLTDAKTPAERTARLKAFATALFPKTAVPAKAMPRVLPPPLHPGTEVRPQIISYEHPAVKFGDGWLGWQRPNVGTLRHVTDAKRAGAKATLTFAGSEVGLFDEVSPRVSSVVATLDGGASRTVAPPAGGTFALRHTPLFAGLDPAREHVLTLEVKTAAPLRLAGFSVSGSVKSPNDTRSPLERMRAELEKMPPVTYVPPAGRFAYIPETMRRLREGGELTVVMLGDSIINDTSSSRFDELLMKRYPKCRIRKVTSVRGGTGCDWYAQENRVRAWALRHKPDLMVIGGISHRPDPAQMRDVVRQIRAEKPDTEFLLLTPVFGTPTCPWNRNWTPQIDRTTRNARAIIERIAADEKCAFFDMTGPLNAYIRDSGIARGAFMRDVVHADTRGKAVLGELLDRWFASDTPGRQP